MNNDFEVEGVYNSYVDKKNLSEFLGDEGVRPIPFRTFTLSIASLVLEGYQQSIEFIDLFIEHLRFQSKVISFF